MSAVWTHGKPGTHQWSGRGSEPGLKLSQSSRFMIVQSLDDGQTSSDHGTLPEPMCNVSLISHKLEDVPTVLFFSNPNHTSKRKNMTVRVSLDDGTTRGRQIVLDKDGEADSSLVMVNDRTVGILYESSRADLVFQTIGLDELGL